MAAGKSITLFLFFLASTSVFSHSYVPQNTGRKLFGGYRIVPKVCQPTIPSRVKSEEPAICMFNYECSRRNGEVVGACMDGFLFGACCQLPRRNAVNGGLGTPTNAEDILNHHEIDHVPDIPILLNPDGTPIGMTFAQHGSAIKTERPVATNHLSNGAPSYTKISTFSAAPTTAKPNFASNHNTDSAENAEKPQLPVHPDFLHLEEDFPALLGQQSILDDLGLPGLLSHSDANNDIQDHQDHSAGNPVTTLLSPNQILQIADPVDQLPALFSQGLGQDNYSADTILLNENGTVLQETHNPDDLFKPSTESSTTSAGTTKKVTVSHDATERRNVTESATMTEITKKVTQAASTVQFGENTSTTQWVRFPDQPEHSTTEKISSPDDQQFGTSMMTKLPVATQMYANTQRLTSVSPDSQSPGDDSFDKISTIEERVSTKNVEALNSVDEKTTTPMTTLDDQRDELVRVPTITYDAPSGNKKDDIMDKEEIAINHIISILNDTTHGSDNSVTAQGPSSSIHTWVSIDETVKPSLHKVSSSRPVLASTTAESYTFPYTFYKPGQPSSYYNYETIPTETSYPTYSTSNSYPSRPSTQSNYGGSSSFGYSSRPTTNPPAPTLIVLGPLDTEFTTETTEKPVTRRPTIETVRPSSTAARPTASSISPIYSSISPSYSSISPIYSSIGSTVSSIRPTVSSIRPTVSSIRPTVSSIGSTVSSISPVYSSISPTYSSISPTYSSISPTYSSISPTYSSTRPVSSSLRPVSSSTIPVYSSTRPASVSTKKPSVSTTITHNISTVISNVAPNNNHVVSTSYITVNLNDGTTAKPTVSSTFGTQSIVAETSGAERITTRRPTVWTTLSSWSEKPVFYPKPSTPTYNWPEDLAPVNTLIVKDTTDSTTASVKLTTSSPPCDEETAAPDDLINFPPVRNPHLNLTAPLSQQEKPNIADAYNNTRYPDLDMISESDIPTPTFVEDDALTNKVDAFVNKIVQSLQGNFQDLKDVVYNRKNATTVPPPTVTRKPTSTTKKPLRKPTQTTKPLASTTRRPATTKRPASRPTPPRPISSFQPTRPSRPTSLRPRPTTPTYSITTRKPQVTTKRTKPTRRPTTVAPVTNAEAILFEENETSVTTTTEAPTTISQTFSTSDFRSQCGVRPLIKSGRIVGGKAATFGEWPWQVLVREATWLGLFTKNKCGGVLITDRYVITAAHCQPGFLATLVAVFGEFDLSGELEAKRSMTRNVRRVIVNRSYDPATFESDLALLELESPVQFDAHIVPICMPDEGIDFTGRMATVTGWGRLKYNGGVPSVLQEVQVPIIKNSVCQEMFQTAGHSKLILDSFLCAGYANGQKDSCEGDSGGPLVMQRPDGRWFLVGTVSHGIKCASPYLPGVYMRTTFFKPWLHSITGV